MPGNNRMSVIKHANKREHAVSSIVIQPRSAPDRVMGASSFALFVTFGAICVGSLVVGQLLDFQFVQPPLFLPNDVVTTIQPTIVSIS